MLLIIFGAGASYDNNIEVMTGDEYPRLPLTNNLINPNLPSAQVASDTWQGAVPLLNRLNKLYNAKKDSFNLEELLYLEFERNKEAVKNQLLSFKFYIYEIIKNCEIQVRNRNQGNTNYTQLLSALESMDIDQKIGIALVTFNYDTLIEKACSQIYPDWDFNNFEDYILGNPKVRLYKPHGSLNWRQNYETLYQPGKNNKIKVLANPNKYGLKATTQQVVPYNQGFSVLADPNSVDDPMLALPYRVKTTLIFMDNHKQTLFRDIKEVTHILTIGWRGTEEHFQDEVMSLITKPVKVLNVNTGSRDIEDNLRKILKDKIIAMQTFPSGFSKFIESENWLTDFLKT